MEDLAFIRESNFDTIVTRIDFNSMDEINTIVSAFIDHAPFMSQIISRFLVECINCNEKFKESFERIITENSNDSYIKLSRCIYAAYLGAQTNIPEIKSISNVFNHIKISSEELKNHDNSLDDFYCFSILKEMKFSLRDCIDQLSFFPPNCIINNIIKDQSFFNLSVLIQMCRYLEFLEVLASKIDQIQKKKELIACIFLNYSNYHDKFRNNNSEESRNFDERKEIMNRLIQSDVLEYCLKVSNKQSLGNLLNQKFDEPVLRKISFLVFKELEPEFKSKSDFFDGFILLTSPSISHFLSYLEQFKNHFKLKDQEQIDFVLKLKTFHSNNTGYLDIAIEKLLKFKILKPKNIKKLQT